jgi:hypothetical protein
MSFLNGLDGAFKKTEPKKFNAPSVKVDIQSVKAVIAAFLKEQVADLRRSIEASDQAAQQATQLGYEAAAEKYNHAARKAKTELLRLRQRFGSAESVDRYLTELYTLTDYSSIWGEMKPRVPFPILDTPYIIGQTTEVIIEHDGVKYSLGEYRVMVPLPGEPQSIHWVPMRQPNCWARHPHHKYYPDEQRSGTCYSSFQDYVVQCVSTGEFLQLLRLVGKFAHGYNPYSPLVRVPEIPFKTRVD